MHLILLIAFIPSLRCLSAELGPNFLCYYFMVFSSLNFSLPVFATVQYSDRFSLGVSLAIGIV